MLYDGDCGLCSAAAGWLGRRAPVARLRILPLADAAADATLAPLVAGRDLASTLHLVTADSRVVTGARAVLAAGRTVPRWGKVARLADHRAGHAILEPVYRLVAANRHRIGKRLGVESACAVPAPATVPPGPAAIRCEEPTDQSVG
jgi:predicted DCC family thiol-disulfide oxidoreductase YuxK